MFRGKRVYSPVDGLIIGFDQVLSAVFSNENRSNRENPAAERQEDALGQTERRRSAGLMRVNHAGEVAAQALYSGQALVARGLEVRQSLLQAAVEESAHLYWCADRVKELDSHVSYLTPFWYLGSFAIGTVAGLSGDKWNLGFVLETERQVVAHLDKHLRQLPEKDRKSRCILEQMREDELQHATGAMAAGAAELPRPIKTTMRFCSKVMTTTAYWL